MAELPPYPGTPRWVYWFGTIIVLLLLVFVVKHVAGGGVAVHAH